MTARELIEKLRKTDLDREVYMDTGFINMVELDVVLENGMHAVTLHSGIIEDDELTEEEKKL